MAFEKIKIIAEDLTYNIRVEDKKIIFSPKKGDVEHEFRLSDALVFEQQWARAIARLALELSKEDS